MPRPTFRYRPEIDGLRSLAVLPVVFFHANLMFPGGFVGVDVFFVISGYLITSLLLRDLDRGTFSMWDFWERRIRRIAPALFAMVAGTSIMAWFFLAPADFADFGKSVAAQALIAANVFFLRSGNYFGGPAEEKPLLHTWSLAVEEQFYLFVPVMLFLFYRIVRGDGRNRVLFLFIAGFVLSLLFSIYQTDTSTPSAFYLLPSRAWELLAGSVVAALPAAIIPRRRFLREILSLVGLAGILIPVFCYSKQTLFPGLAALPPVLGAALFIFANNRRSEADPETCSARSLRFKPVVFIGLISYSLYLWHWPIMALSNYWFLQPEAGLGRYGWPLAMIAVSVVLACLSYKFIETPFREKKVCSGRLKVCVFGAGGMMASFAMGIIVWKNPSCRLSGPPYGGLSESIGDGDPILNQTLADIKAANVFSVGPRKERADILIWGDSHAKQLKAALDRLSAAHDLKIEAVTYSSTPPLLDFHITGRPFGLNEKTPEYSQAVFDYIKRSKPRVVIIAGMWPSYNKNPDFAAALARTSESVKGATGSRLIVMKNIPLFEQSIPKVYLRNAASIGPSIQLGTTHQDYLLESGPEIDKLHALGLIDVIRFEDTFFDHAGKLIPLVSANGQCLYRDMVHLSDAGAVERAYPLIEQAVAKSGLW